MLSLRISDQGVDRLEGELIGGFFLISELR